MHFPDPAEEAQFRQTHAIVMAHRFAVYVPVAMLIIVLSTAGHVLLFPRNIWLPSVLLISATMLLPLLFTWYVARRADAAAHIYRSIHLTSVSAALGVCLLLASARKQGFPLPYEGTLLVMMCVFLASGLRALDASRAAAIALGGLVLIEWTWPITLTDSLARTFFGSTLWLLGVVFSLIIERAERRDFRQRELLHRLAQQDPLTGLLNRRGLENRYAGISATARRDNRPLAMALVDIDHFKPYNDFYGHDGGDATLVAVSKTLAAHARRPQDLVARLGGEEFLLAWYDVDAAKGIQLADELCAAVAALALPHQATGRGIVTISIGVAADQPPGEFEPLYRRADEALYAAKKSGRNRACLESPDAA